MKNLLLSSILASLLVSVASASSHTSSSFRGDRDGGKFGGGASFSRDDRDEKKNDKRDEKKDETFDERKGRDDNKHKEKKDDDFKSHFDDLYRDLKDKDRDHEEPKFGFHGFKGGKHEPRFPVAGSCHEPKKPHHPCEPKPECPPQKVPDSASTLALASLALVGLGFLRRR